MLDWFRESINRLLGRDNDEEFLGGILEDDPDNALADSIGVDTGVLDDVSEWSEFWDYWIEEGYGESVVTFSDADSAMRYVDEAPVGVLGIAIEDGEFHVWRIYDG